MIFRYVLCLLGVLLVLPVLGLIGSAFVIPVTLSGTAYLAGGLLIVAGLILAPWGGKYSFLLLVAGGALLASIAAARILLVERQQTSGLRIVSLPEGAKTRWLNALIDEQDSLIFGAAIFHRLGGDTAAEHEGLTAAFQNVYSGIRAAHSVFASPVLATYLNLQGPAAFDAVIVEPELLHSSETAVIFLHGFMGNVTAQCWEIAQAAKAFDMLTVCPSTGWTGQWSKPRGEAILISTFEWLRGQGVKNFYLGGFSNGGFGISRLASKLGAYEGLRGLFFINGISDGAAIKEIGLSTLVIQGAYDERVPVAVVRQTASLIGAQATYVELEGDHFVIMKQPELVRAAIGTWLEKQLEN